MFDAVASILFTVALATTGLSFLESEIVCETIRTASCVDSRAELIDSPLNGWVPWGNNHAPIPLYTAGASCFDESFNATAWCIEAAETNMPSSISEVFVRIHLMKSLIFFFSWGLSHTFWTKHVVAMRHVKRGPTIGLMLMHSLLVLMMGVLLVVLTVSGAVSLNEMHRYVDTHEKRNDFDFYKGIAVFLSTFAPSLYALGAWSLLMVAVDFFSLKWRYKPQRMVLPAEPPRDHGAFGIVTQLHCPCFPGARTTCAKAKLLRSLFNSTIRCDGYGRDLLTRTNNPLLYPASGLELEGLEGVWGALAVLRCSESLKNAICFFVIGVIYQYLNQLGDAMAYDGWEASVIPLIIYVTVIILFRMMMDSDGAGFKQSFWGSKIMTSSVMKLNGTPASPWRAAFFLDQFEQHYVSRQRVHVFTGALRRAMCDARARSHACIRSPPNPLLTPHPAPSVRSPRTIAPLPPRPQTVSLPYRRPLSCWK